MAAQDNKDGMEICSCLTLQQASRQVAQFYNRVLAASGLRVTQYSILVKLANMGKPTINELARVIAMDRTTMGQNLRPLEKQGLLSITVGKDRRSREVVLTSAGKKKLTEARALWRQAQDRFEMDFGDGKADALRSLLQEVTTMEFLR